MTKIGVLHPGEMGISIASAAMNSGHQVYWVSEGRSRATQLRAEKHGLTEVTALSELCSTCEAVLSVCPPHAAEDVAHAVIATGFQGSYLDANAISNRRSQRIGQMMQQAGIRFVDGGIIGGPAWTPNETWLYLSGSNAEEIEAYFRNSPLSTKIIGTEIGKASALKMCYAAYSKGTTALLAAILATAESLGVRDQLYQQWDMDNAGFSDQVEQRVRRVTAKAWRFEGEMREIAETFQEAGLPSQLHGAAAEIYRRMAGFKNSSPPPSIEEILSAITDEAG